MHRSALLALASAICLACAAAPAAANTTERYAASIEYGDLNLSAARGADAFIARTLHTARATCGDRFGPMSLAERSRIARCEDRLATRAVTELGNPTVTARYQQRGGRVGWVTLSSR